MAVLVTEAQARAHLRLDAGTSPPTDEDLDFAAKLEAAEALILRYVRQRYGDDAEDWEAEVDAWDVNGSPAVVPPNEVQAATLVLLGHLYRYRGDDEPSDQPKPEDGMLPPLVRMLLGHLRDGSLA